MAIKKKGQGTLVPINGKAEPKKTTKKKYDTSYYDKQINSYNNKVNKDLANSISQTNAEYRDKMAEAYVTRMQNQKTLEKSLANQGIKGGASETAQLGLLTNYGNTRNTLQGQKTSALTALRTNAADNKFNYAQTVNAQKQQYLQDRQKEDRDLKNQRAAEDRANKRADAKQKHQEAREDKANRKTERYENYRAKYSKNYSVSYLKNKLKKAKTAEERRAINERIGQIRAEKKGK